MAWVWSFSKYCSKGVTVRETVMSGKVFAKAAMIFSIAPFCAWSQML